MDGVPAATADLGTRGRVGWWRVYLAASGTAAVAYFLLPPAGKVAVWAYFAASSVAAIAVGVRMHRPERLWPWVLIGVNQLGYGAANVDFFWHAFLAGGVPPLASSVDWFYLVSYLPLLLGLWLLVRTRSRGRESPTSLLDGLIIATTVAVISLVLVVDPQLHQAGTALAPRAVSVLYPGMDLLVLAIWARLWAGQRLLSSRFGVLTLALLPLPVGDFLYTYLALHDQWRSGTGIDVVWMVFQVGFGVIALHPSMRTLGEPPAIERSESRQRLGVLLACTTLVPTALLLVQSLRHEPVDLPVLVGGSVTLFGLTATRLGHVVQSQRRVLRSYRHAVARETALREAGATLVACTLRSDVYAAALRGARALTTGLAVAVRLDLPESDDAVARGNGLVIPVPCAGPELAALVVDPGEDVPAGVRSALAALAAQTGLALQRTALSEQSHQQRSEQRLEALVRNVSDLICVLDDELVIRYQSPAVTALLGVPTDEQLGSSLLDTVHPDDACWLTTFLTGLTDAPAGDVRTVEFRRHRADGEWRAFEGVVRRVDDGELQGIVLTSRDITERKALEDQLRYQAFHDGLTGLPNRLLFHERAEHALRRVARTGRRVGVLLCDLDDFKTVNDSLGHAAGDGLLAAVGERIASRLRPADTVARLGGDEFALVVEDVDDEEAVVVVAERVLEELQRPFTVDGHTVTVRASIGVAVGGPGDVAAELLRNADMAMYLAKRDGKDRHASFHAAMHDDMLRRLALSSDLAAAVERDEFVVHYQPIVELQSGVTIGFEALVRWQHPGRGLLLPGDFIPLAEETGLIVPIGSAVLREACRQLAEWQCRWPADVPLMMSVNLSARQLQHPELLDDVRSALESSAIDPSTCTLEITESLLMHDTVGTLERLTRLKDLGVRLAIDDFGTGYSSLSYLRRFPVDRLKVAKEFVDTVTGDAQEIGLVETILTLAATLGLEPIAEGIEHSSQREQLHRLGCGLGQGYHFARPAAPEVIEAVLAAEILVPGPLRPAASLA